MNKEQLVQSIRTEQIAWRALLTEVGDQRITLPNAVGAWSIKDMVAHVTFWEQRAVEWLIAAQNNHAPARHPWTDGLSEDEENAWIFDANKDRPLQDILEESRQAQEQLVRQIEAVSEEDLSNPKRFEWLNGNSLADSIPGNSFEHYREHSTAIREWLRLETAK